MAQTTCLLSVYETSQEKFYTPVLHPMH